jgi:murein DD-endopeptidase MepM/ murein hydrolase activator NlpD
MPYSTNISITTHLGVKHFALGRKSKWALYICAIALLVACSWIIMHAIHLNERLSSAVLAKNNSLHDNKNLIELNLRLAKNIDNKDRALSALSHVSNILGLKNSAAGFAIYNQLNNINVEALERNYMFNVIPNGYPSYTRYQTSAYGMRWHPIRHKYHLHAGVDFGTVMGSEIVSTAQGVVEYAGFNKNGFGNLVRVRHSFGFVTYYGHLQSLSVKVGDFVHKGDALGFSGNSGLSSGPHLHYAIKYINKYVPTDSFLQWNINNYTKIFTKVKNVKWYSLKNIVRKNIEQQYNKDPVVPYGFSISS